MSILSVGLLMSQIDFLLIRLLADLMVNSFTTFKFLKNKEYNKRLYYTDHNGPYTSSSDQVDEKAHSINNNNEAMQRAAEELTDVLSDREDRPLTGEGR